MQNARRKRIGRLAVGGTSAMLAKISWQEKARYPMGKSNFMLPFPWRTLGNLGHDYSNRQIRTRKGNI
jgi:hypothetical protein